MTIRQIQDATATCHPALGDTIRGVGGIIIGFDPIATGFDAYIQNSGGGPFTGIDFFTHSVNTKVAPYNFALGDSIVVESAKVDLFGNDSEIDAPNGSFGSPNFVVRKVSSGNTLPPFFVGTTTQFKELLTNTFAKQYLGCLVKMTGSFFVARTSLTGGLGQSNAFLIVDNAAPSDSVFIDGNKLSTYAPPAVGSPVTSVQGVMNGAPRGWRIMLRNGNDIVVNSPPNMTDAFPITDNTVKIVYDRDVVVATATNTSNYSLASFGTVNAASMITPNTVVLTINNAPLGRGDLETVTVNGIQGLNPPALTMTTPQSRTFVNSLLTAEEIQRPNPDSLGAIPCVDRSRFAGPGGQVSQGTLGPRCSMSALVSAALGSTYYLMDSGGPVRGGLAAFAPPAVLVPGHTYRLTGQVQEFFGVTELSGILEVADLGTSAVPAPLELSIATASNATCDVIGNLTSAEDFEGVLIRLRGVLVVDGGGAGASFRVAGPIRSDGDTLLVANLNGAYSFAPVAGARLDVVGELSESGGAPVLYPRSNGDIIPAELIDVDRMPIVLHQHVHQVAESVVPRGYDVVLSPDTVTLVVSLKHLGSATAHGVVVTATPPAGMSFDASQIYAGDIAANGTVNGTLRLRVAGLASGSYAIPLSITSSNSFQGADTIWVPVWSAAPTTVTRSSGQVGIHASTPFATHAAMFHAPQQQPGPGQVYFQLQDYRDTVVFAESFTGVHWGSPLLARSTTPGTDGSLQVLIRDRSGHPVSNARVTITVAGQSTLSMTDGLGRGFLSIPASGTYTECIDPPANLAGFYRTTCATLSAPLSGSHQSQVDAWTYPLLPNGANVSALAPPPNAQGLSYFGAPSDVIGGASPSLRAVPAPMFWGWLKKTIKQNKSIIAGVLTGVGTGLLDTASFGLSAGAVIALAAAAAVAADPSGSDLTDIGEEQTPPNTASELTQREITSVTCQYLQAPAADGSFQMAHQYSFTRTTSAQTYVYSHADTIRVPSGLWFDSVQLDPAAHHFSIAPHDSTAALVGDQAFVQAWVFAADGSTVLARLSAHDDGLGTDQSADDGTYTLDVPTDFAVSNAHIFVLASKTGFDTPQGSIQTAVPAASWKELTYHSTDDVSGSPRPTSLALSEASPNPFRLSTRMSFALPQAMRVAITLYDQQGRKLRSILPEQSMAAGRYEVSIARGRLAPGIYFCRLVASGPGSADAAMSRVRRVVIL